MRKPWVGAVASARPRVFIQTLTENTESTRSCSFPKGAMRLAPLTTGGFTMQRRFRGDDTLPMTSKLIASHHFTYPKIDAIAK